MVVDDGAVDDGAVVEVDILTVDVASDVDAELVVAISLAEKRSNTLHSAIQIEKKAINRCSQATNIRKTFLMNLDKDDQIGRFFAH
jgi:hypothetical protein